MRRREFITLLGARQRNGPGNIRIGVSFAYSDVYNACPALTM
jgi:hypothetical protein